MSAWSGRCAPRIGASGKGDGLLSYLDNAATSDPKPAEVIAAMSACLRESNANVVALQGPGTLEEATADGLEDALRGGLHLAGLAVKEVLALWHQGRCSRGHDALQDHYQPTLVRGQGLSPLLQGGRNERAQCRQCGVGLGRRAVLQSSASSP